MTLNIEKSFLWLFSLEFLDYQYSDATKKINKFSPQNSSTSAIFQTEFMMEEFKLVVADEDKFEYGAK